MLTFEKHVLILRGCNPGVRAIMITESFNVKGKMFMKFQSELRKSFNVPFVLYALYSLILSQLAMLLAIVASVHFTNDCTVMFTVILHTYWK